MPNKDQWLFQLAASLYDPNAHQHIELEDLVQEGRLAVWQLQQSPPSSVLGVKEQRAAAGHAMLSVLESQTSCSDLLPKDKVAAVICSRAPASVLEVLELALQGHDDLHIAKALDTKLRIVRSLMRRARLYFLSYYPLSDTDDWVTELRDHLTED